MEKDTTPTTEPRNEQSLTPEEKYSYMEAIKDISEHLDSLIKSNPETPKGYIIIAVENITVEQQKFGVAFNGNYEGLAPALAHFLDREDTFPLIQAAYNYLRNERETNKVLDYIKKLIGGGKNTNS